MCSSAVDLTNVSHFLDPYESAGELIPLGSSPCFIGGLYRLPVMPDVGTTKNKQIKSSRGSEVFDFLFSLAVVFFIILFYFSGIINDWCVEKFIFLQCLFGFWRLFSMYVVVYTRMQFLFSRDKKVVVVIIMKPLSK
jgi:hypothetical protein